MPGPNDPFGALSPFEDITSPEEQFAQDMLAEATPADLGAIDLSTGADPIDPAGFPTIEDFNRDMAPVIPDEVIPEPLDEFQQALIERSPESFDQLEPQYETDTGFAPPIDRPETGVTAEGELGEYQLGGPEYRDTVMDPDILPSAPVPVEDLTDRALMLQQYEAEQEKAEQGRVLQAEADAKDAAWRSENLKIQEDAIEASREKLESIYADSKAISEAGVDNNRWWGSRSTGQKLAAFLAIGISGQQSLLSGRGGNDTLDLIQGEIDRDIATQKFNIQSQKAGLQQRRGLVAEIYEQTGDLFRAEETARLAARQGISAEISNKMAGLDPEGTQARNLEMQKRQWDAATLAKAGQIAQATRENAIADGEFNIKLREQSRKEQETAARMAKIAAETAKLKRRGTGRKTGVKKYLTPDKQLEFTSKGYEPFTIDGALIPSVGPEAARLRAAAPVDLKTRKLAAEAVKAEREVGAETLGASDIVDKDGNPVLFQDKATAIDVSQSMGATNLGLELIDEMLAEIAENGWSSNTMRSDAWQRAQANMGALTMVYKDTEKLGALAGADIEIVEKVSGMGDDITGVRDPSAGLRKAAKNLEKKMNHVIKGYRPNAKIYKFKRKAMPKREEVDIKGVVSEVGKGLRPDIAALPPEDQKRKDHVAAQRAKVERTIADAKDPFGMRRQAKDLAEQVKSGNLTEDEAIDIATPLGMKVAQEAAEKLGRKHKGDIQKLSVKELKDPDTEIPWLKEMKRLESLANPASQHPMFRKDVWEYLTTEGE